jgi:hypothetical protein
MYEITENELERLAKVHLLLAREIKSRGPVKHYSTHSLINSVIMVAGKFIGKVERGEARSVETFSDMQKLKIEAELLKKELETQ